METNNYEKLIKIAFDEMEAQIFEEAEKHFDQAYTQNPDDWRCFFYRTYCKTMYGKIGDIPFQCQLLTSVTTGTIKKISELNLVNEESAIYSIIEKLNDSFSNKIANIPSSVMLSSMRASYKTTIRKNIILCSATMKPYALKYERVRNLDYNLLILARQCSILKNEKESIDALIREIKPDYNPAVNAPKNGCYIATCVYGSYDCPQVWTLRRYRDEKLGSTWHGRLFIKIYYAISPTLVKLFGKTNWFKRIWRHKLDKMIRKCNERGYANTPYQDKDWR